MVQHVKHHYVYLTKDSTDNRLYIGRRSSVLSPEKDPYMGSHTDKTYKPDFKQILRVCCCPLEAALWEWLLHECFNVGVSSRFANRSKARIRNFSIQGMRWWTNGTEDTLDYKPPSNSFYLGRSSISGDRNPNVTPEARAKQSERVRGSKNPGYGKTGDQNVSRRPEVREKLSKSSAGASNSMYGKPVSEERRKKASEAMKRYCSTKDMKGPNHPCYGLKWWTNGDEERKSLICPEGWRRGRKPRVKSTRPEQPSNVSE